MNLYQLHIFWLSNGAPFLIDSFINESAESLTATAIARKANNADYRCVLVTYKAEDANIV
jgi:hypothetical protein